MLYICTVSKNLYLTMTGFSEPATKPKPSSVCRSSVTYTHKFSNEHYFKKIAWRFTYENVGEMQITG